MTDNEIIKALECCGKNHILGKMSECKDCHFKNSTSCITELIYQSLDLINRQKADYENLQAQEEKAHQYCKNVCEPKYKAKIEVLKKGLEKVSAGIAETKVLLARDIEKAKAEAVKEFAERFKSIAGIYQKDTYVIGIDEFDNLVKEMVGDDK